MFGEQTADCPEDQRDNGTFSRKQSRLLEEQGRLFGEQSRLFEEQDRLFEEQSRLFEEQSRLFEEQSRLFEEQSRLFWEQGRLFGGKRQTLEDKADCSEEQGRLFEEQSGRLELLPTPKPICPAILPPQTTVVGAGGRHMVLMQIIKRPLAARSPTGLPRQWKCIEPNPFTRSSLAPHAPSPRASGRREA